METTIARTYKNELQRKVAELLKEFEKTTGLAVDELVFTRQSQNDAMGNETGFNYAVEAKIFL